MAFHLNRQALAGSLCFLALLVPARARDAAGRVSAWTFGDETSLNRALARNAIGEVNVDWYHSRRNGFIDSSSEDMGYVALAKSRGLRVLATVSNYSDKRGDFDSLLAHRILKNPRLRERHLTAICRLCVEKGFDGIDLDWESVFRPDRNRFTRFVQALAGRLHRRGKILSIAVHAKTSEPGDWFGARSQDYAKLGAAVDEFKIMTYDYSGSWSEPGPVAPPVWADAVLTFAESVVAPDKIMMGLPFYGYDWDGEDAEYRLWTESQGLITAYSAVLERDASGEATFRYTDAAGKTHTVFFQDRLAIRAKLQMLRSRHPDIRGIAIWCMGGEDEEFWDEIASQLGLSP